MISLEFQNYLETPLRFLICVPIDPVEPKIVIFFIETPLLKLN